MSCESKLSVERLATVLCYVEFYPCHVQNGLSKLRSKRITVSFVRHVVKESSRIEYRILVCISIFFRSTSTATGFFYRDSYDRFRTLYFQISGAG